MTPVSTADLSALPEIPVLEARMKAFAMLDAIVSPEWDYRYYSYNAHWSDEERMGSIRNGSGDDLFALFGPPGCYIKGLDHEACLPFVNARAFYAQVPPAFASGVEEPAFSPELISFCCWRGWDDPQWHCARVEAYAEARDGSEWLLRLLDGDPRSYVDFARDYFEVEVEPEQVVRLLAHEPLTRSLVLAINPDADFDEVKVDAGEGGYPVAE